MENFESLQENASQNVSPIKKSAKNTTLFFFELIASIFIVFIHCGFPSRLGALVNCLARFAVPLFFCVSGFYLLKKDANVIPRLISKIKKILVFALVTCAIYFIYSAIVTNETFNFNLVYLFNFLLFNSVYFVEIAWFLFALLYVYLFLLIFNKCLNNNVFLIILSCLWVIGYILNNVFLRFDINLFGYTFSYINTRNWLFLGLPCVSLGILLRKLFNYKNISNISYLLISFIIIFGAILSVVEYILLDYLQESYIGSLIIVFGILLLCEKNNNLFNCKLTRLKGNITLYIYILHVLIGIIVNTAFIKILRLNGSEKWFTYSSPIIIALASVIVALIVNYCIEKIKSFITNK